MTYLNEQWNFDFGDLCGEVHHLQVDQLKTASITREPETHLAPPTAKINLIHHIITQYSQHILQIRKSRKITKQIESLNLEN